MGSSLCPSGKTRSLAMGVESQPPGFCFRPTDEELVGYYLYRRVHGFEIYKFIPIVELYKFDPWELPEKSFQSKRGMHWFFFRLRDRKYPNGTQANRATNAGNWKATGKDRKIVCPSQSQSPIVGYRKTLVFYRGRAPVRDRTDWVMHEYRLCDDVTPQNPQGALCRVIKKNEAHSQKKTKGSSSVASPCPVAEEERTPRAKNIWVSPGLILDSSQVSDLRTQYEYQVSGFPFEAQFANFGVESEIGGGGVSPYESYMGFGGRVAAPYESFMGFGGGEASPFESYMGFGGGTSLYYGNNF